MPGKPETSIIEYPLVQHRLIPVFASVIGVALTTQDILTTWYENQESIFDEKNPTLKEIHALSSALKPYTAWFTQKGI